ncbi:MAG TPA: hypothetical protein VFW50_35505 [Streptosporangiaceae bacterium]|nr:hypothetical protein [Streptosporangiaceae bacterium]
MTATPHPACPLCGLRFGSRPLLDLHIREDHRRRDQGGARIPMPRSGTASDLPAPASTPLRTTEEVTAMTAARPSRPGGVTAGPRRVVHALRYVNGELTRAFEAIVRSARAPRPRPRTQATEHRPRAQATEHRPRAQATADGSRDTAAERAGQAA